MVDLLGSYADGAHLPHVCVQHTFIRRQEKSNCYSFPLEANVCLRSLALPSSEYLLNLCLKEESKCNLGTSGQTFQRTVLKLTRAKGISGWKASPQYIHRRLTLGRTRMGPQGLFYLGSVCRLLSVTFLGPGLPVSSSRLWKFSTGVFCDILEDRIRC